MANFITVPVTGATATILTITNTQTLGTINVYRLVLVAAGAAVVTVKDGSTAVTGAMTMAAGVPLVLLTSRDIPLWQLTQGNNLVISQSGTVQVSGWISYEISGQ